MVISIFFSSFCPPYQPSPVVVPREPLELTLERFDLLYRLLILFKVSKYLDFYFMKKLDNLNGSSRRKKIKYAQKLNC